MVLVENPSRFVEVEVVLAHFLPGQVSQRFYIADNDGELGGLQAE